MSTGSFQTKTQQLRTTALPHPYRATGLDLTITGCTLDDEREVEIESESQVIPLTTLAKWQTATITGTIDVLTDVIKYVFPDDEQDAAPGKLFVAIRCRNTILRDQEIIEPDTVTPGEYEFEFDLNRNFIRGGVELQPYLIRASERNPADGRYAAEAGTKLASDNYWKIEIDESELPEGLMRPIIENFSEHDGLPSGDHLHYLDLSEADRPRLYLNGDHGAIINVMGGGGTTGPAARMEDVIYDQIENAVWPQLIIRTATDINEEGETRHNWQDGVLEMFYDKLYDEDIDITEAALNLREDVREGDRLVSLTQSIDNAVQTKTEPPEQLVNLLEEGLK